MKIKKKPNNVASPRLDHSVPGAAIVFLCISRRTILLSAKKKPEQGQSVSLQDGAESSTAPRGSWKSEQQEEQQQTGLEGRLRFPLLHPPPPLRVPTSPKNVVPLAATSLASPGAAWALRCHPKDAVAGSRPHTMAWLRAARREERRDPGQGFRLLAEETSQPLGRSREEWGWWGLALPNQKSHPPSLRSCKSVT